MKKIILICLSFLTGLLLVACGGSSEGTETKESNQIAIPVSSQPEDGDYQSILKQLEDAGFENVSTQKIEDLTFGIFTKDGEIEKITVKGDDSFSKGDLFDKDTPITIHYHTFKEYEDKNEGGEKEVEESSQSSSTNQSSSTTESSQTTASAEVQVLTAEHPDFAYVLNNEDEGRTKEFVEKYRGQIVEFDGHVAHIMPYEGASTRFDYLIYAGNWEGENYTGIPMKFENVNYYDLHLPDDVDSLTLGMNIHIKARIIGSAKLGQLIFLEPLELSPR